MKTNPATHTPTPWEVTESGTEIEIQDADGTSFAGLIDGNKVELAQRIVRAVNAHEELLDSLKYCRGLLDHDDGAKMVIDNAIAKAEGK